MSRTATFFAVFVSSVLAWNAGVGIRNINPSAAELATQRIYLGGYGALGFRGGGLGYARSVADSAFARAFLLEDLQRNIWVNVIIDTIGIGNVLIKDIREGAAAATGISIDSILVSATHTHCGADLQGLWGGVTPSFRAFVVQQAIDAIREAFNGREPADVFASGRNPGTGYQGNRRGWPWTVNTTTVIDAFALGTNRRIGTYLNFAAHPVTLGANILQLSSDYVGYMRDRFEATSGAPLVWCNGALGDVSPGCPGCQGSDFLRAQAYGHRMADLALDILRSSRTPVEDGITLRKDVYEQSVSNLVFLAAWAAGILEGYYLGNPTNGFSLDITMVYFKFGRTPGASVEGVSWPGEALTRNAFPVQNGMRSTFTMNLGLTLETIGYLVPTDEWMQLPNGRDYEETISPDRLYGDTVRNRLLALMAQTDSSSASSPADVAKATAVSADRDNEANKRALAQALSNLAERLNTALPNATQSTPHFFLEKLHQALARVEKK